MHIEVSARFTCKVFCQQAIFGYKGYSQRIGTAADEHLKH